MKNCFPYNSNPLYTSLGSHNPSVQPVKDGGGSESVQPVKDGGGSESVQPVKDGGGSDINGINPTLPKIAFRPTCTSGQCSAEPLQNPSLNQQVACEDPKLVINDDKYKLETPAPDEIPSHINRIRSEILFLILSYLDDAGKLQLRGTCSYQNNKVNVHFTSVDLKQCLNENNIFSFLSILGRFINLKSLNLSHHSEVNNSLLKRIITDCPNVSSLKLQNVPITGEGLKSLYALIYLKHLDISFCSKITDRDINSLHENTGLEILDISWCYIREYIVTRLRNAGVTVIQHGKNEAELIRAARESNIGVIKDLVNKNVPIDTKDSEGDTSAMIAAGKGDGNLLDALLGLGANIEEKNVLMGYTVLMYAANNGVILDKLLSKKPNINQKNIWGNTVLIEAVHKGNSLIVRRLLEAGADINIQSKMGFTPVIYAVIYGFEEVLRELLKYRPNLELQTCCGDTALKRAIEMGNINMVSCLLEAGADIGELHTITKTQVNQEVWLLIQQYRVRRILLKSRKNRVPGSSEPGSSKCGLN